MNQDEEKLIDECIESHYNMIRFHRRQIIELSRRKILFHDLCDECFKIETKNEDR